MTKILHSLIDHQNWWIYTDTFLKLLYMLADCRSNSQAVSIGLFDTFCLLKHLSEPKIKQQKNLTLFNRNRKNKLQINKKSIDFFNRNHCQSFTCNNWSELDNWMICNIYNDFLSQRKLARSFTLSIFYSSIYLRHGWGEATCTCE